MIHISKQTLFNNFSGRVTPIEKTNIAEWLLQPENQEFYFDCLNEWENQNMQFVADDGLALKKIFEADLVKDNQTTILAKGKVIRIFFRTYAAVASVVLILVLLYFLAGDSIFYKTVRTDYGQIQSVTLPDGSLVNINANSSIRFPRFGFGTKSRLVYLSGEAFFSVIHTKSNQPFIVKTEKNIDVTVLGTQFDVYTRGERTKVVLQKGKIVLSYLSNKVNQKTVLRPGDLFIAENNASKQLRHIEQPEKLAAWGNHDFSFDGTSMTEIGQMVKENFNVELKFESKSLGEKKISGFFHADTLDELLNAIADLLDVNFSVKDDNVYFFQ